MSNSDRSSPSLDAMEHAQQLISAPAIMLGATMGDPLAISELKDQKEDDASAAPKKRATKRRTASKSGKSADKKEREALGLLEKKVFNKSNQSITVQVQQGRLTLLSRKILNVFLYRAQQYGRPGINAPANVSNAQKYYWITLADIIAEAAYNSNDTALLKRHIDRLQDVRVYHEDATAYTSERLIASVKIVKQQDRRLVNYHPIGYPAEEGSPAQFDVDELDGVLLEELSSQAHQLATQKANVSTSSVFVGFMFPPEVESMVLKPSQYTKLSLYYQAQFRSIVSLTLYEACRRYLTSPGGLTARQSVQWWYNVLMNMPAGTEFAYKYFKRDYLQGAIKEINSVSDIEVELIEHRMGRSIAQLQFKVVANQQISLGLTGPSLFDPKLVAHLRAMGIQEKEASELLAQYAPEQINAALRLTQERRQNPSLPELVSASAYFRRVLKNSAQGTGPAGQSEEGAFGDVDEQEGALIKDEGLPIKDEGLPVKDDDLSVKAVRATKRTKAKRDDHKGMSVSDVLWQASASLDAQLEVARTAHALDQFDALTSAQQGHVLEIFLQSPMFSSLTSSARSSVQAVLDPAVEGSPAKISPSARSALSLFLAAQLWPRSPSQDELVHFEKTRQVIGAASLLSVL